MHIKPPDDNILQSSFPLVWWESEDVSIAEEAGGGGRGECNSCFNLVGKRGCEYSCGRGGGGGM